MLKSIIALLPSLLLCSCTHLPAQDTQNSNGGFEQSDELFERNDTPNAYGWDDSNCAHIQADGHCAHPTGANSQSPEMPNAQGWNSSNCAHITADGSCAHEL
ncbi:MAG: hypothetical protein AAF202_00255 [Pseudomonadota bacterium]